MYSLWQNFTLSNLAPDRWLDSSYVHRWVGSLKSWRESSWLMQWGDEIGAILAGLVFVLSPFIPTESTGLLMGGVAGFWLLLTLSDRQVGGTTPIHVTLLVFWAISALAAGLSPVKDAAIGGLGKLSLYLLLFLMLARLFRSPRFRDWLIGIYLNVALVVSVYGVNQSIYGAKPLATWVDPESSLAKTTRVYSYLNNPNLLGGYLLPAIAFSVAAFFVWRGKLPKTLALVMLGVDLYCLQATYCRGAWIGIVVMLLVAIVLLYYWFRPLLPKFWRSWGLPVTIGSIFVILGLATVLVPSLHDRVASIFVARGDSSNNFRINVWQAVRKMIQDRPILGIGPGDRVFKKIYPIYQVSPRYSALSAYSLFMETIVETGFIGLAALIWSIVVTFNQGVRGLLQLRQSRDPQVFWLIAAIVSLVGMICQGFVDTVWYRPEIQTLWWFCVALIAGYYQPTLGNRE
jgi:putative inorganic carbon (HCO3(-)) transporter